MNGWFPSIGGNVKEEMRRMGEDKGELWKGT